MSAKRKLSENFGKRLLVLSIAILFMGIGVSLLLSVSMGQDSFSTVNQGLVRHIPISFGTSELIMNGLLLLFIIAVDRGQIGIGTVLNMVCLGYIADFFNWVQRMVLPAGFYDSFAVRIFVMLLALAIFIISCACYIATQMGVSAYDAMPIWISKKLPNISERLIRITWDLVFILAGWAMGATVGIVTFLMAFLLGPTIEVMRKILKKWLKF